MKTFQDYIDQYGLSGYKYGGGQYAPTVMMLHDEIANPGSTQLSLLNREGLVKLEADIPVGGNAEQWLGNGDMPFLTLHLDGSNVPVLTPPSDLSGWDAIRDEAFKEYAGILYVHGEANNPFIQHTDRIENNGTVDKDIAIGTNVNALSMYYMGAVSQVQQGSNFLTNNSIVHTTAEMTNMLKLVIQYGVATAADVQKYFGNYIYAPGVAAAAIATETKLPVVHELSDSNAAVLEKAYIAYYGRPADPSGLAFWVDAVNKTGSVTDMVNLFGNSVEYKHLYSQASSATIVGSLYEHLFNREGDSSGLKFWTDNLDAGKLTLANIAFELVNGAQSTDLTILNEKISAATTFTASLDTQREVDLYSNDLSALNARKWLSTVGADHSANVTIVGIANDVINQLQGSVDGVLAGHGLHPTYY